ncbi:MAG TPA: GNAT family N-acetyltransferase, partial [Dokdonella sp.]
AARRDAGRMIAGFAIRLAGERDAEPIATMSRDLVEHGMRWQWTPARVLRSIRERDVNVAVAPGRIGAGLRGFGIMRYTDDEAHLLLLAVDAACRRRGLGAALMRWLEDAALAAGVGVVHLEARAGNDAARAFYRALGYREIRVERGLYSNREDGVRIAKDLWQRPPPA